MNLMGLFILLVIAVAAVIGIVLIGSYHTSPITDTSGNAMPNSTNTSQGIVTNVSAVGSRVGGGVVLLIAGIIAVIVISALAFLAMGSGRKPSF